MKKSFSFDCNSNLKVRRRKKKEKKNSGAPAGEPVKILSLQKAATVRAALENIF